LFSITNDYQAFTDEVVRQGIEFAALTQREGAGIGVALNLEATSFLDHGLVDRVAGMLEASGLRASNLTFEITESNILEDLTVHGPVFERLTALGVDLAIDDFGVGYSSLSRLRELPVQELKIDRGFVSRMESDAEDLIIVKAVVDLANVLGHRSVAEGVETIEAWDRLREMGCDQAQGFLFGRPMPPQEFLERYAANDGVRRFTLDSSAR
jgi:EAL domain-containing protein (putative c-di-GMP-specific phosphodiesterase class I)